MRVGVDQRGGRKEYRRRIERERNNSACIRRSIKCNSTVMSSSVGLYVLWLSLITVLTVTNINAFPVSLFGFPTCHASTIQLFTLATPFW